MMVVLRRRIARAQAGSRPSGAGPPDPPSRFARLDAPGGRLLMLNPADDADFLDRVRSTVAGCAADPTELQDMLRVRYPAAVVRRRELSNERAEVWYVYRDGRWVPRPTGSSAAPE